MSKTDLATYQFQLGQVEEALEKDPENPDLLKLKSDLVELVNLYTTLVSQEESKASESAKAAEGAKSAKATESAKSAKAAETAKSAKEKTTKEELVVGHVEEPKVKKKYVPKKEKKPSKRDIEFNQKQADWQSFNSKKPKLAQKKATFTRDKS